MGIAGSTTGEARLRGRAHRGRQPARRGGRGLPDSDADPRPLSAGVAAQGLGIAQGATDYALEYARTRETMGKPIADHQLIAGKLADMETRCEAARGSSTARANGRRGRSTTPSSRRRPPWRSSSAPTRRWRSPRRQCRSWASTATSANTAGAHDARRGSRRSTRGRTRSTPGDRPRDAQGIARVPPHRRRVAGSRAVLGRARSRRAR